MGVISPLGLTWETSVDQEDESQCSPGERQANVQQDEYVLGSRNRGGGSLTFAGEPGRSHLAHENAHAICSVFRSETLDREFSALW